MKKIITLLLLAITLQAFAQSYPIDHINISLPINPNVSMANWGSGATMLTISATTRLVNGKVEGRVEESKILVTIKKGGSKICGAYANNTAPATNFTTVTKVWNGSNAVSLLGQDCTLQQGEYELCVQFFGNGPRGLEPISEEKYKPFTIKGNESQNYQPPQPMSPVNGNSFSEADIKKPIIFRWTPVIPKPRETFIYKLRVWQLMEGQSTAQAIIQPPILGNDVGQLTQTTLTNLISGLCEPPYLCNFVWNVQALNREGKPIGSNNGTSEVFTFTVFPNGNSVENKSITAPILVAPANGFLVEAASQIKFTWLAPNPKQENIHYKIKIVEIKGDQSPEAAFRTNKPFFEKDSSKYFKGNKPHFEKDSLAAYRGGNKPFFEKDSLKYFKGNKPIFEKDSLAAYRGGNKPFFEKGSLKYFKGNKPFFEKDFIVENYFIYPAQAPPFKKGNQYTWFIQTFDSNEKPVGKNEGKSEIVEFSIGKNESIK